MAHGLARQLGGALTIRSELGEGTCVDMLLPVAAERIEAVSVAAEPFVCTGEDLKIFLVDDENLVRQGTAEMLQNLGHDVVQAVQRQRL